MTTGRIVNQLVIATVTGSQSGMLTDRLTGEGFSVTQIDSSGLGEELAGGEMWIGDQIILGVFEGRLVFVEAVPLFPEEVQ